MTRIVRYVLLPALVLGCAVVHAQIEKIGDRCKLTPDMQYLMVKTLKSGDGWAATYVTDDGLAPGWAPAKVASYASLQEGKKFLQLPDETPVYCEVNVLERYKQTRPNGPPDQIDIYIFSFPSDMQPAVQFVDHDGVPMVDRGSQGIKG